MNVDAILNGIVIDHITAGKGMVIYDLLGLRKKNYHVAILLNASSSKMGKKDMIKIDSNMPIDYDLIGYVDPNATINVIRNGKLVDKVTLSLPKKLVNVLKCKNPRCITTQEQELDQVFRLTDEKKRVYRCLYCEVAAKNK